MDDKLLPK